VTAKKTQRPKSKKLTLKKETLKDLAPRSSRAAGLKGGAVIGCHKSRCSDLESGCN